MTTERENPQLAVCPHCEAETSDEVIAMYEGVIDGMPVQTRVVAVICPFCGYLDSWAETPEDVGFKAKYDSYRPNPVKFVNPIPTGRGGLKYYKYWVIGLRAFTTKAQVLKALELGQVVYRKDKLLNTTELFNFKTNRFEEVSA